MTGQHTYFLLTPSLFTRHRLKLTPHVRSQHQQHLLSCTFSKSLTNNWAKLIEPYNQAIKVRITTKDIKKEDRLFMKSPTKEGGIVQRVFFKFIPPPPVSGLNLSINISAPQLRVKIRKIEHDTTFEIPYPFTFGLYKSFHKTSQPPWHDLINSPPL